MFVEVTLATRTPLMSTGLSGWRQDQTQPHVPADGGPNLVARGNC